MDYPVPRIKKQITCEVVNKMACYILCKYLQLHETPAGQREKYIQMIKCTQYHTGATLKKIYVFLNLESKNGYRTVFGSVFQIYSRKKVRHEKNLYA